MYIISVIPLTKIPLPAHQTLDYFSTQKISIGGVVRINISARSLLGIVISCAPLKQKKQQIKRSPFQLKPIIGIVNARSVIPRHHLELVIWASAYFYSPLGLTIKALLPRSFAAPTKKFLAELADAPAAHFPKRRRFAKPILYWYGRRSTAKITYYRNEILGTLKSGKFVLFLVPQLYKIDYFKEKIPPLMDKNCAIGTRSALSEPRENLGLIIIDDEESPFYKSFDQQPYLDAKTIALKLAELTGAKIILGSELPSVESFWKARNNAYALERAGALGYRAQVSIEDMRQEIRDGNYSIFSRHLQDELKNVVAKRAQAILFINRKGLNTGLLCRDCGHIIKCPNCDVPMVYHSMGFKFQVSSFKLICHHCGHRQKPPTLCPKCESYRIKFIGTGTQRVVDELIKLKIAPLEKIARLDLDSAPTLAQQLAMLEKFRSKKYPLLVCTQVGLKMELLPQVALAAMIATDPMFSMPDFRIYEHFLQIVDKLWTKSMSLILLQTYNTAHSFIGNVSNKIDVSLMSEIENRRMLSFPPFSQLIKLTYSHPDPKKAEQEAKILKNKLEIQAVNCQLSIVNCQILGPAPAFIPRLRNRFIWQIVIKSKIDSIPTRNKLLRVVPSMWKIDVDPIEIL